MAKVLSAAYRSRYAPEFIASLPLAGIDGTLRSRMKTSPAGSVRMKTGHLDGVTGVAGYVTTPAGKTYVLVSLVNDPRADYGAGEPIHGALVSWMQGNLDVLLAQRRSGRHRIGRLIGREAPQFTPAFAPCPTVSP